MPTLVSQLNFLIVLNVFKEMLQESVFACLYSHQFTILHCSIKWLMAYIINTHPPHTHILNIPITLSRMPYALSKSRTFCLPVTRTNRHRDSPLCAALHSFNQIPIEFRNHSQRGSFKNIVTEYLLPSICTCSDHSSVQFLIEGLRIRKGMKRPGTQDKKGHKTSFWTFEISHAKVRQTFTADLQGAFFVL